MNAKTKDFLKRTNKKNHSECFTAIIVMSVLVVVLINSIITHGNTGAARAEGVKIVNIPTETEFFNGTVDNVKVAEIKATESRVYTKQELAMYVVPIEKEDISEENKEENAILLSVLDEDLTENFGEVAEIQDNKNVDGEKEINEEQEIFYSKKRVNSISGLTKAEIKELINNYEGLRGIETAVYELDREGINAFFTLAVIRLESGNGEYTSGMNNYFNTTTMSGAWVDYGSRDECIEAFGELITKQYFDKEGRWYEDRDGDADSVSLEEMEIHYCPSVELDPNYNTAEWIEYMQQFRWSYRVGKIMDEMYYDLMYNIRN